eukprot:1289898-Rhodomonas_salina.1
MLRMAHRSVVLPTLPAYDISYAIFCTDAYYGATTRRLAGVGVGGLGASKTRSMAAAFFFAQKFWTKLEFDFFCWTEQIMFGEYAEGRDGYYAGMTVLVTSGPARGQTATVVEYDGSNRYTPRSNTRKRISGTLCAEIVLCSI